MYQEIPCKNLKVYIIRPGIDAFNHPVECELAGVSQSGEMSSIAWKSADGVSAVLDLRSHEAGYCGTFRASGTGCAIVRLVWQLPEEKMGFPFIPAAMYGCNEGGASPFATYPQLDDGTNMSYAKPWIAREWLMRADRSSHGFTSVIAESIAYAIGGRDVCRYADGSVAEKTGLGVSFTDPQRLTFSLGFANVPYTYSTHSGRNMVSRTEGYVNLDSGEVSSEFFLFAFEHASRSSAAARLLRESYGFLHDEVAGAGNLEDGIRTVSDALVNYLWSNEASNFYVLRHEDPCLNDKEPFFSSAWTGGLRVAYPLLVAGNRFQQKEWLDCARVCISNIADTAISPKSGLFNESFNISRDEWSARGWWYPVLEKPGHSGYINGQVCHYMLAAYIVEKEHQVDHAGWLSAAKQVLDHVASVQGEDGRFGYTYSEADGSILDGDGFSGCWFTPAFATLYRITGDDRYLKVASRAMDFYRRYVEEFHVWGGPHDIFKSPDEEGILAWIEAARILHETTSDERYLKDLLLGLDYEFSWKFAYNVVNEVEPLKSLDWCSTGGSVTSVNNLHIHPMGSQLIGSLIYAHRITGDPYLKSRLRDTILWTLTVYQHRDGHYSWGRRGMVNERFCYTDSLLTERFSDGSPAGTWFCALSWASGAVLEGLLGVSDEDFTRKAEAHESENV